jgi:hypothetical protein
MTLLRFIRRFFGRGPVKGDSRLREDSSTSDSPVENAAQAADHERILRARRVQMLRTPADEMGFQSSKEFPRVFGVLMEFEFEGVMHSIVAMWDGNASVYCMPGIALIGGVAHESVREAAIALIKTAEPFEASALPTAKFPYPDPGRISFHLMTTSGVRVLNADFDEVIDGNHQLSVLFQFGNEVFTQMRLVAQKIVSESN